MLSEQAARQIFEFAQENDQDFAIVCTFSHVLCEDFLHFVAKISQEIYRVQF